ncbi:uncharacterized protein LOC128214750 isoform X1 [Mya arenaria]|uniref:uncharacterized protein LOC128214750 isoform X1 n=1 Tax=Mya arenaria TaxID=6604 RepID=UPI0022E5AC37|nr:uncharacterized protein LOC128214750 isoform X1 [Mya arenaria]
MLPLALVLQVQEGEGMQLLFAYLCACGIVSTIVAVNIPPQNADKIQGQLSKALKDDKSRELWPDWLKTLNRNYYGTSSEVSDTANAENRDSYLGEEFLKSVFSDDNLSKFQNTPRLNSKLLGDRKQMPLTKINISKTLGSLPSNKSETKIEFDNEHDRNTTGNTTTYPIPNTLEGTHTQNQSNENSETNDVLRCPLKERMAYTDCGTRKSCPSSCSGQGDCAYPYCDYRGECQCREAECSNGSMCWFYRLPCQGTFSCIQGTCRCDDGR